MRDESEGIYDDGEWISWDWINSQIHMQELKQEYPNSNPVIADLFESLVDLARRYRQSTGRYLQIWGELGELYAEVAYGIKRHRPRTPGSDGRLGNDLVEVKTISPEKGAHKVGVKLTGNFNRLLVVRIDEEFEFESRMLDRAKLGKSAGKVVVVSWSDMPPATPTDDGN